MIFAREVSGPLTSLVKKIDAETVKNKDAKMGSFVVFLNDEEGFEKKLKDLSDKEKLEKIALAIDSPRGPEGYEIAKDAEITVVLYQGSPPYSKGAVKANYAFKKGELSTKDVDKILKSVPKILPDE